MIYLLNEFQTQEIKNINNASQNKLIICDYGLGNCIEDSFLSMEGFENHKTWFNLQNIEGVEKPIVEEI